MSKTTNELETGLAAGKARVLDVRSAAEYRSGHIEGAVHLPIEELEKLTHYPAGEDGTELWLVCQSERGSTLRGLAWRAAFWKTG